MGPLHRVMLAASAALLVAGGVAVGVTHYRAVSRAHRTGAATSGAKHSGAVPPASTTLAPAAAGAGDARAPAAGTAALEADLVTPTDMGGYYRTVPSAGEAILAGTPCLGVLRPSAAQAGRAVTALLGPDAHSVPTVVEEVVSYPGRGSDTAYTGLVKDLAACPAFRLGFDGLAIAARMAATTIPPVGDADRVWSGGFTYDGSPFTCEAGAVLDGHDVLVVVWIDRVPPSDPVMGSFTSTVSLAIGKLA